MFPHFCHGAAVGCLGCLHDYSIDILIIHPVGHRKSSDSSFQLVSKIVVECPKAICRPAAVQTKDHQIGGRCGTSRSGCAPLLQAANVISQ